MQTEKHTVTIPLNDYNELLEAKENTETKSVLRHLGELERLGVIQEIDITKIPRAVQVVTNMVTGVNQMPYKIIFNY
jgi:hypothetical protein